MFADLHAHYPMRVVHGIDPESSSKQMRTARKRPFRDRLRALIMKLANRIGNFPTWDGTYRIDAKKLREGEVSLAMSVLFRPFDEMDLSKRYAAPPDCSYFRALVQDLQAVEDEVKDHDPAEIRVVHNRTELERAIELGATALVHAVEGGFHLGNTDAEIEANCAELAKRGVGYVTVAHLFFRQVATNANAVPFIPDRVYRYLFPQCGKDRLTPRGETLVRSLCENRILPDLSHMDPPAIRETLTLLDTLDPERRMPVVSTHAGYRFGRQRYMHDEETVRRIADRGGVIGLIMAQHQLQDGILEEETTTIEQSLAVIFEHIDKIRAITGSYDHIGLGTDLDGFIKPTMGGIESISDLTQLEAPLLERYGDTDAEKIMSGNALRVLRAAWPFGEGTG